VQRLAGIRCHTQPAERHLIDHDRSSKLPADRGEARVELRRANSTLPWRPVPSSNSPRPRCARVQRRVGEISRPASEGLAAFMNLSVQAGRREHAGEFRGSSPAATWLPARWQARCRRGQMRRRSAAARSWHRQDRGAGRYAAARTVRQPPRANWTGRPRIRGR